MIINTNVVKMILLTLDLLVANLTLVQMQKESK